MSLKLTSLTKPLVSTLVRVPKNSWFETPDEFIDVLTGLMENWDEIERNNKPAKRLLATQCEAKRRPTFVSSKLWKPKLEDAAKYTFRQTTMGNGTKAMDVILCIAVRPRERSPLPELRPFPSRRTSKVTEE